MRPPARDTFSIALICSCLMVGFVLNMIEYPTLDAREKQSYRAGSGVPSYRNADISELVQRSTTNAQAFLRFYFVLADSVDRPTLLVHPQSILPTRPFLSMAVGEVRVIDYEPDVSTSTFSNLEGHFVEHDVHAQIGEYAFALDDSMPRLLLEVSHGGITILTDPDLLPPRFQDVANAG